MQKDTETPKEPPGSAQGGLRLLLVRAPREPPGVPKVGFQKWSQNWTPKKTGFGATKGRHAGTFGGVRRPPGWPRGGKEGTSPSKSWKTFAMDL